MPTFRAVRHFVGAVFTFLAVLCVLNRACLESYSCLYDLYQHKTGIFARMAYLFNSYIRMSGFTETAWAHFTNKHYLSVPVWVLSSIWLSWRAMAPYRPCRLCLHTSRMVVHAASKLIEGSAACGSRMDDWITQQIDNFCINMCAKAWNALNATNDFHDDDEENHSRQTSKTLKRYKRQIRRKLAAHARSHALRNFRALSTARPMATVAEAPDDHEDLGDSRLRRENEAFGSWIESRFVNRMAQIGMSGDEALRWWRRDYGLRKGLFMKEWENQTVGQYVLEMSS
ncbi:uncharacterized protein AB675_984 [Cyphellophora attinorum]|uniref:Uncharacterized protein n=1 Tax=Cyphellophora attinorum TaxID=1664694 RepID=A0A0N1H1E6_9EURO|nr:uncharacterized protein AB675_984 [Phialophora attinorum]KPI38150.1 hypothetical protein AB675_984 [Phialophora attinorum]